MVLTTLIGYLVLVGFLFTEGRIRSGQEAKSYKAGHFDKQTTKFLDFAYFVSILTLLAVWLLKLIGIGALPAWISWLGIVLALLGPFIRWWANRVLGAFYTRMLKVAENQVIVQEGLYRIIRHPGYLGSILMWGGVAAATANWIVLVIVSIVMISAYTYRIENEEKMLVTTLADYSEYRSHTRRLIPFIF
jgi:protein-S-isoprenylcysteine O-methyltransferase Ste14